MIVVEIKKFIFLLIGMTLLFLINKKRTELSNFLKVIDHPDKNRKIHETPTPLIGCFAIFIITTIYNLYEIFFINFNKDILIITIIASMSFIIGFLDDKNNINAYKKLILLSIIFFFNLKFSDSLIINKIYFESLDLILTFNNYSIFFTILCSLLLINALNLADGINALTSLISFFWLLYLTIFSNLFFQDLIIIVTILLIINSFLIYKGNYFLGDSGTFFLGSYISLIFIYHYNTDILKGNYISAEELFILFMVPGIDMFRLFIVRIIKKKDPFKPDKNHLHHYLLKHFNLRNTLIIYLLLIIIPILSYKIFKIPLVIISTYTLLYLFFIRKIKIK